MATTKLWAVRNNLKRVQDYALDADKMTDLAQVLDYAQNEDKTEMQYYMAGINCDPTTAYQEFTDVKEYYGKQGGLLAYHGYMSFKPEECTPDEALKIGKEFAKRMWGDKYQVVVTVHLNTECLHCHFVVNSVSFKDGMKLRDNEKNWNYFRHTADDVCREYGKSVVDNEEKKREPTKRDKFVKEILDYGLNRCRSIEELQQYFLDRGHKCQFDPALKHWTITPKGWTKPYRISHLEKVFEGSDYSKEAIMDRLAAEPNLEPDYEPVRRRSYRQNSYPNRKQYVEKRTFSQMDQNTYLFVKFADDAIRLLGSSRFMPLHRYRQMRAIRPIRAIGQIRPLGPVSYTPAYKQLPSYYGSTRISERQERVDFINKHRLYTKEDIDKFWKEETEELKKIEQEKKLLENRSKTERMPYSTEALDKKKAQILRHRKILSYYMEDREHGSNSRR